MGFEVKTDRGTRVRLFSVAYGDLPIPPEDPQKEGYDFVKWEPDITTVRGKQRYTAKFVSKEKVTITFDTMGGTGITKALYIQKHSERERMESLTSNHKPGS